MKFISRSLLILFALYGLVFAVGDMYLISAGGSLWMAIAFPIIIIGLQYLMAPWLIELVLDIQWDDSGSDLPVANREFIQRLCSERGLKVPRIGIIHSGTPNAFSFGRTPRDARVVVTTGLLEVLSADEANAVLAHEIGHVEHWDFMVMTFAALAPLVLYQFYVFTNNISNVRVVAYTAYLCYLLSQFMVLLLNRTREYFADHYAADVTHAPDTLSSALVKIAYGMVRANGQYKERMELGPKEDRARWRREYQLGGKLALMGISNLHSGAALALGANPADAAAVMRWDLVNPWARLYELSSTHPLTALRVRELNRHASAVHQPTRYELPQDQSVRWGAFPLEVIIWAAPFLSGGLLVFPYLLHYVGITVSGFAGPFLLMFTGATWMLRIWYRYRGSFQDATVGKLIEDLEVSQMRPRAVRLTGKILGRGVPGAFWSPDLVLRDETGILFVLYRQSIPFARFVFAVSEAESYIGQDVMVEGWFRRGLVPYVELSRLIGMDGSVHRTYSRWIQLALAIGVVIAGLLWLLQ